MKNKNKFEDFNCTCNNDKLCAKCIKTLKKSYGLLILSDHDKEAQIQSLARDFKDGSKELKRAYEELDRANNNSQSMFKDLSILRTQFYTVIGFLLIVTTAITSAVYFYAKETPAVIKEHKIFSDEWYGPALYFGAPILLVFFTFLFAIWFFQNIKNDNNIKHKGNYPIFKYFKNNLYILILVLIIDYYYLSLSYNWSIFWLFMVNIFLLFSKPVQLINEKLDAWIYKKTQLGIDKVKNISNKNKK